MSDTGLGGVDFSLGLENLGAELAAYFATPEGQANLAASGFEVPVVPTEPDYTQIVNDAYAPKYANYFGGLGTGGTGGGETGGGKPTSSEGATIVDQYFEGSGPDRRQITIFSNGYRKDVAAPEVAAGGGGAAAFSPDPDARNTIKAVLSTYGLESLADVLWNNYTSGLVDINNEQALVYSIRDTDQYKTRFSANAARMKKGLAELSPGEYIGLEDFYRQTMQSNGLPPGFYDQTDDFSKLIEGDVSPSELQDRIQQGYAVVAQSDPEVKRQMQTLYGVTEGQLAAYFIDPERTAPLLKQQARAAQIAARSLEQGGIQLTGSYAENLAARGITEQQARAGFAEVGALGELRQTFAGETALSSEQLAGAAFGIDVAAQQELERRRRLRTGEFAGGGSFARTTGETSGSISTSVGKAQ